MLVNGGGEESNILGIAEALKMFRLDFRESIESQWYVFLQFMDVTCLIDIVEETLGLIFLI